MRTISWQRRWAAYLATAALLLLSGLLVQRSHRVSANPVVAPSLETAPIHVSWAQWYRDTQSLKQAADIVVVGTFVGNGTTVTSDKEPGIVLTDFPFAVDAVITDPQRRVQAGPITVRQTGGIVGTTRYAVEGDPLFQPAERAVLFLHEYSPGHYYVIGGPSGRFLVQAGVVLPVAQDGVKFAAPPSEAAFIDAIRNR